MTYIDEEILKQQKMQEQKLEQEERLQGEVAEGKVVLDGKEICFEKQVFLDGQLTLMVPTDLRPMSEEEINGAYLLGNRPQYLFRSEQLGMSFVLNHTENVVSDNQVIKMASVAGKLLERATMNGRTYRKINFSRSDKTIATVELVTNGLDDSIYSLNFYISIKERLLLGNWSCQAKGMAEKKLIAMQMLETIEITELDNED